MFDKFLREWKHSIFREFIVGFRCQKKFWDRRTHLEPKFAFQQKFYPNQNRETISQIRHNTTFPINAFGLLEHTNWDELCILGLSFLDPMHLWQRLRFYNRDEKFTVTPWSEKRRNSSTHTLRIDLTVQPNAYHQNSENQSVISNFQQLSSFSNRVLYWGPVLTRKYC